MIKNIYDHHFSLVNSGKLVIEIHINKASSLHLQLLLHYFILFLKAISICQDETRCPIFSHVTLTIWNYYVTNEEVLRRVNKDRQILNSLWQMKQRWIDHVLRHDGLLHEITEGRMRGKPTRGRKIQMLHDFANDDGYVALKWAAKDRDRWRHRKDVKNQQKTTELNWTGIIFKLTQISHVMGLLINCRQESASRKLIAATKSAVETLDPFGPPSWSLSLRPHTNTFVRISRGLRTAAECRSLASSFLTSWSSTAVTASSSPSEAKYDDAFTGNPSPSSSDLSRPRTARPWILQSMPLLRHWRTAISIML